MSQQELRIFDNNNIRSYWDEEKEQWFFCINDVVQALTDSRDVKQYIKRLRQREPELNSVWGTICTPPPIPFDDEVKDESDGDNEVSP